MPIIQGLLSRLGYVKTKAAPSVRVMGSYSRAGGTWVADSQSYDVQARHGYQRNSDVYACISLIANAAKQVKWWDGSAGSKSVTPHDVLVKECMTAEHAAYREKNGPAIDYNPKQSVGLLKLSGGPSFLEEWVSYLLLAGDAFIEILRNDDAGKTPVRLELDRPDRVRANPSGTVLPPNARPGAVEQWQVTINASKTVLVPSADMVHSKLFNPLDDIYGMAPLAAAMLRVTAQNEGAALMTRAFQAGVVPGWVEVGDGQEWTDVQVAQFRERLRQSRAAGEELFMQNAKFHPVGFTPADSGVSEQHSLTKRDIASVFHVPSQLIGDTAAQTYANWQEARRALYMEAVIPLLTQFKYDWNRTIGAALRSPLDFDRDSFDAITAARQEATDRVTKLWTSGLVTQAEARADLEYPPAKPGDEFMAPANLVPLGSGGESES